MPSTDFLASVTPDPLLPSPTADPQPEVWASWPPTLNHFEPFRAPSPRPEKRAHSRPGPEPRVSEQKSRKFEIDPERALERQRIMELEQKRTEEWLARQPPPDVTRSTLLHSPLPPMDPVYYQYKSTHVSKYRFAPNRVVKWSSFPDELNDYWDNKVPQSDKDACILRKDMCHYLFHNFLPDDRGRVSMEPTSYLIPDLMRNVLKGTNDNPISPSDAHSAFQADRSEDDIA
jgi:hypothetical protein